jgi:hypothetical protein
MNLSDVVRHKQASEDNGLLELTDPLEKSDFMNMRKVQPAQVLTERLALPQIMNGESTI